MAVTKGNSGEGPGVKMVRKRRGHWAFGRDVGGILH